MTPEGNRWNEYEKLVLDKLDTLEAGQKETRDGMASLRTDMAVLKTKAGLWGALAGAVPAGILLALHFFTGGRKQ